MATALTRNRCVICGKEQATSGCEGCSQEFCDIDYGNHRQELSKQLDEIEVKRNLFFQTCTEHTSNLEKRGLIQQIDKWEQDSTNQIRQTAEEARQVVYKHTTGHIQELDTKFTKLTEQIQQSRQNSYFYETNLRHWNEELVQLTQVLNKLLSINLRHDSTPWVTKLSVDVVIPPPLQTLPSDQTQTSSSTPATDPNHINTLDTLGSTSGIHRSPTKSNRVECVKPATLVKYQETLSEAEQYEEQYKTINDLRKKQLTSPIKLFMNQLRTETFADLTNGLFQFLNGQEQIVANQIISITNNGERLFCLSMLATLILAQLLGGDLDAIKTDIFLPLISVLSEHLLCKEFSTIFLDRLYKKCPYTIPCYPEKTQTMSDQQYLEAMGYIVIQHGDQRLETETEFLNRMSGLIRLFCKLLVRGGPPFDKNLSIAWTWCADIANLPPRSNISSVLLRIYLDEAGQVMLEKYPNQFPKIIRYIKKCYLPLLEKVTSDDEIARFQLTLDTFIKQLILYKKN